MMNPIQNFFHWGITRPWNTWLDSTNKLTQILVAVGGGLAVLRKFGIGAELSITGKPFQSRGIRYLIVTARFKNTGHLKTTTEDLFDNRASPRTEAMAASAVQWAERIMRKVDSQCSGRAGEVPTLRFAFQFGCR